MGMNIYDFLENPDGVTNADKLWIIDFVKKHLILSNGRITQSRVNEQWFKKWGHDWSLFAKYNINTPQDIYDFLINPAKKCSSCGEGELKWRGLRVGYTVYCLKCSRTVKNWAAQGVNRSKHKEYVPLDELIAFVKPNSRYVNTRILKVQDESIQELKDSKPFITWDATNAEYLYCLEHNINSLEDLPKCKECSEPVHSFHSGVKGYWDLHSGECAVKWRVKLNRRPSVVRKIRKANSALTIEKMNYIPEGYTRLRDFDFENYLRTGEDFITLKCTKGHEYDVTNTYQGRFQCFTCFPRGSKTQTEIYNLLKEHDSDLLFNDRKLIAPKEIDILSNKHKFGIEYNSQSFHSSGVSSYEPLNKILEDNYHLDKTEHVESKVYQLFHVFSSEYINPIKQEIWNSMFLSKMGRTERIYARKCEVKEITAKELREFSESNHLQGHVNARVKLGLFYEDELVQVMSFGTPRQAKYKGSKNYELLRMCSKVNCTVIGGASKLLKHFERNYEPELVLSYANRRWSTLGNVYEKLGFELEGISKPNYFYFKGKDEDLLESRVKYQKHKLKDFKSYSEDKTETQIMFEEGYRKIYDSGNLIYIKKH